VNEAYAEFSVPILPTLGASGAVRYSDYSNFGNTTTYKGGLRWQPIDDFEYAARIRRASARRTWASCTV